MVSFCCDSCTDVVKKPKLDQHYNSRCGASFTCLDCSKTFYAPPEWKSHTSCISEAQKYERTVWQGDKKKGGNKQQQQQQRAQQNGNGAGHASNGATPSTSNGVPVNASQQAESSTSSSSSKRKHDEAAAANDGVSKADKKAKKAARKAAKASNGAATDSRPAEASATPAAATSLRQRVVALAAGKQTSLYDLLESHAGESKKLQKELLKSIMVGQDGSLAWA
ncbi:hypothetical protein BDZ90DRAFT_259224 [Jaminaea rosea]|uniref:Zinc finger C2H2 LYAR-type domain-containing protein n=1 Tax=Jaminaea rosea TaxID=1569628 RepID=A0A316UVZ4_9BASI|nr:hypothetical protein BDZ90DRAFT_259224 [Jaminaea rosea]PWN29174.1 hypothetical protein BDZ90DRAFT_259224 [Jaminaea rosea]